MMRWFATWALRLAIFAAALAAANQQPLIAARFVVWLGQLAVAQWPAAILLALVIWQRGQVRALQGYGDAWYTLWYEKAQELTGYKEQAAKRRVKAR